MWLTWRNEKCIWNGSSLGQPLLSSRGGSALWLPTLLLPMTHHRCVNVFVRFPYSQLTVDASTLRYDTMYGCVWNVTNVLKPFQKSTPKPARGYRLRRHSGAERAEQSRDRPTNRHWSFNEVKPALWWRKQPSSVRWSRRLLSFGYSYTGTTA